MTHEPELPDSLGVEDFDGYTLEELSDYVEAGRAPRNARIESSPSCRIALEALERLRDVRSEMLRADIEAEAPADEIWIDRILSRIPANSRPGRRIPLEVPGAGGDFGLTEGAVRGLVRGADAVVPGALIGRCRIRGDVDVPLAPVSVEVEVSVCYGYPIGAVVDALRGEIAQRLAAHTQLHIEGIDIDVVDLQVRGGE